MYEARAIDERTIIRAAQIAVRRAIRKRFPLGKEHRVWCEGWVSWGSPLLARRAELLRQGGVAL